MALVTDISTAKKFLRLPHVSDDASLPDIAAAEEDYIVPVLGRTLYDELVEESVYDPVLLEKVQRAIVCIAYLNDLAENHAAITDAGVRVQTGDNMPAAPRWSYMELKESLESKAAKAVEGLYEYLVDHATELRWRDPTLATIFKSGKQFSDCYHLHQPHRVFNSLKPVIAEVQDHYLYPVAGEGFVVALCALASPGAEELTAIKLMRKAVASLAIFKSRSKLPVKIGPHGFTVMMSTSADQPYEGNQAAPKNQLDTLAEQCENDGERYLKQLKEYLDKTASSTIFPTYFSSDYYTAPSAVKTTDRNSTRKGIFVM